ncbi:hypothetical protein SPB21_02880 [Leptothoe sp. ISB3NOV94-8A]
MGYYMRYIVNEDKEISLGMIETALRRKDPNYSLANQAPTQEYAELLLGTDVYGALAINRRGSELMDEELEELLEDIDNEEVGDRQRVQHLLQNAHFTVILQVLWQGRGLEATLEKIDPLWEWLFEQYQGLLQADGEGYYDINGQILEVGESN